MMSLTLTRSPAHFTFLTRDMVYGVLDTAGQASALCRDLNDRGVHGAQVLSGPSGLVDLDRDGHHHGVLCRAARAVQGFTREHDFIGWYADQLAAGHVLVYLHAHGRLQLDVLRSAFARHGGHHVNHYGLWMVEVLCP